MWKKTTLRISLSFDDFNKHFIHIRVLNFYPFFNIIHSY